MSWLGEFRRLPPALLEEIRATSRQIALPDGALPFPGGLAIENGDFYVSINAGSPGGGKVIRIHRRGH